MIGLVIDWLRRRWQQRQCVHGIPSPQAGARPGVSFVTTLTPGGSTFEPERILLCRPEMGGCGRRWLR